MSAPSPVMVITPLVWPNAPVTLTAPTSPDSQCSGRNTFHPQKQAPAPAATTASTKISDATHHEFFRARTGFKSPPRTFGTGRSPTLVPVMMNFESSVEGACGAVIFWKHVGHSITVPACDESHIMCWPHTGQAYLNS